MSQTYEAKCALARVHSRVSGRCLNSAPLAAAPLAASPPPSPPPGCALGGGCEDLFDMSLPFDYRVAAFEQFTNGTREPIRL